MLVFQLRGSSTANHSEIVSWLWGVADLIRDTFKRGKYQDVILPLTVLRRLDCVLAPTKEKVLKRQAELKGKLENLDGQLLADFRDGDTRTVTTDGKAEAVVVSRVYPTTHFGFRKISVERPLRLNFQASPERIARLEEERGFQSLAESRKKGAAGAKEQAEGRKEQDAVRDLVKSLPKTRFTDRVKFEAVLTAAVQKAGLKLPAPVTKAILSALSERDEKAEICRDGKGNPEPDPELRDTESVPLSEEIHAFFDREVKPHVPGAWIDQNKRDEKDGKVGLVGYEINFNRYFYRYIPPRPPEEIEAEIRTIEQDILRMLGEVTGSALK